MLSFTMATEKGTIGYRETWHPGGSKEVCACISFLCWNGFLPRANSVIVPVQMNLLGMFFFKKFKCGGLTFSSFLSQTHYSLEILLC